MTSLFCRIFVQKECPDLIWISTRISEIVETSLNTHGLQRVYINEETRRTDVGPVSRTGRLSSVLVSPDFLQIALEYTPDLGHLVR